MKTTTLAGIGVALALPAVVWANYGTQRAAGYPGLWPYLLVALILLVETPIIVWVCRVSWATGLFAVVVANGATTMLGMMSPVVPPLRVLLLPPERFLPVVLLINIFVEWPVVRWVVGRYHRDRHLVGRSRQRRVLLAVVMANVASVGIVPGFQAVFPNPLHFMRSSCLSNVKQITLGLLMYRGDHAAAPPVAGLAGLEEALLPYVKRREVFECPGALEGRFFPVRVSGSYACPDLRDPASLQGPEDQVPVIWDAVPVHNHGRNVGFLDGHGKWLIESAFQEMMERPPDRGSP